jgi:hypothetical protein
MIRILILTVALASLTGCAAIRTCSADMDEQCMTALGLNQ